MTDDERKPFPDLSRVRRVRIEDEPTLQQGRIAREDRDVSHQMAQAVRADHEREGADDGTD